MKANYNIKKLIKDLNTDFDANFDFNDNEEKIISRFVRRYTFARIEEEDYSIHVRYYNESQTIKEIANIIDIQGNLKNKTDVILKKIQKINQILKDKIEKLIPYIKNNKYDEFIRYNTLYINKDEPITLNDSINTKRELIDLLHINYKNNMKDTFLATFPNTNSNFYTKFEKVFKDEYSSSLDEACNAIYDTKTKIEETKEFEEKSEENSQITISNNDLLELLNQRLNNNLNNDKIIKEIEIQIENIQEKLDIIKNLIKSLK